MIGILPIKLSEGGVNSSDVRTTGGALNKIIRQVQKKSPKTKIIVVTPLCRFSGKTNCDKRKNKYGYTLKQYREVMTKVAENYDNVYVIQGNEISKEMKQRKYSRDGLHPRSRYAKKTLAKRFKKAFEKTI